MKVFISVNKQFEDFLHGKTKVWYGDTEKLIKTFMQRGHDVALVRPEETILNKGFQNHYKLTEKGLMEVEGFIPDLFFVRGFGSDHNPKTSLDFFNTLISLESEVPNIINQGRSWFYEDKKKQKTLPLPFIPGYELKSVSDLHYLVKNEREGVIMKPSFGFQGAGVEYLSGKKDVDDIVQKINLTDENINNFVFEKFIPDKLETRYIYLYGEVIASRTVEKIGLPGKESYGEMRLNKNIDSFYKDVVKQVIDSTGRVYGSVDFRGGYVLETNSSGTGTIISTSGSNRFGKPLLDLTDRIVETIERKLEK